MKKILIFAGLLSLGLASCSTNSSEYKTLKAQYDSLVASVLTNFQEISSVEGMINVNPMKGDIRRSERDRIKDNMLLINDKLRASNDAINALTEKLEKSGGQNRRLQATIAALRKELEVQKQRVQTLTEELERKNLAIGLLDSMLTQRMSDVDRLICLPYAGNRVRQAVDYRTRVPVRFVQDADGIVLKLPTPAKADPDFVVEIEFAEELKGN